MVNANDFRGSSDNETIERAMQNRQADGIVLIPPRVSDIEPERTHWLLDRAILIPENTTVVLQNCTIKLSDRCRDNFFRSANCGIGIENPERMRNIHLRGEGFCTLVGADHPRATGDGSKILACPCPYTPEDLCRYAPWVPEERRSVDKLDFWDAHDHSYGTDAGKEGESQYGDWRGIGVLLANVEHFSVSNLHFVKTHGWAISMEACAFGCVEKIHFDMNMSKEIDGMLSNMENQDGIDVRNGCHHLTISDVSGVTGDDVVALTAIVPDEDEYAPGGSLRTAHVMPNDFTRRERDIHDIIIRNISAYSHLCWVIRLLAANTRIWNVVIDGVIDTAPEEIEHAGTLLLGEGDSGYGKNHPDSISNIAVSNMICAGQRAITVAGYLSDSTISNVVDRRGSGPVVHVERENALKNVCLSNLCARNACD